MRKDRSKTHNTKKRDNSTESSRLVSLLNEFQVGRMMRPSGVSGIILSYHREWGEWEVNSFLCLVVERLQTF